MKLRKCKKITNYKIQITNKLQCPKLQTALSGLKKNLRTSRRRRLNLSEGHPMFVIWNLEFVISRTSQFLFGSGLSGPGSKYV